VCPQYEKYITTFGSNYIIMPGTYVGHIHALEIKEKKPRGLVEVYVSSIAPGSTLGYGTHIFKLDEDSSESFAGMAAICAARAGGSHAVEEVVITVKSGSEDEIDSLKTMN
jgi:hypothetical protein